MIALCTIVFIKKTLEFDSTAHSATNWLPKRFIITNGSNSNVQSTTESYFPIKKNASIAQTAIDASKKVFLEVEAETET
ncbi:hypothetical protein [Paenibacillus pseudetheri]|uniref:Uncharacterized protein n=1 Tax=Paenibacillus pseudetheri TaxID=2897682 RepID=A0ABN8FDY2_9BACL|nr:hypothetical protein [Paenibacillus pseudetheri]CAH1054562.1 hypothetical protein PAECIP111894_00707 [Paenibacillus pseudetheri]